MHIINPRLNLRLSNEATERVCLGLGFLLLVAIVTALWQLTPIAEYAEPEKIARWMQDIDENRYAALIVIGIYVASVLVLFPLTILTLATAMTFGAIEGLVISLVASTAAACFAYVIGHGVGRKPLLKHGGRMVRHARMLIARSGLVGLVLAHMVPVAPFAVVNMALGALPAPFRIFLAGTFLALIPGAVIRSFLGGTIMDVLRHPTVENVLYIALGLLAWLAIVLAAHMAASRLRHRKAAA